MNRRFFCDNIAEVGETVGLSASESYHIHNVLRKRGDDGLILLDGKGIEAVGKILPRRPNAKIGPITCRIVSKKSYSPPQIQCILYVCPPRSQGIRSIIRQAVELGVSEIVPLSTEFSVCKPDDGSVSKWQTDAQEACKQSGNPFLPKIHSPQNLNVVLKSTVEPGLIGTVPNSLTADLESMEVHSLRVIENLVRPTEGGKIGVWIGPEGGFSSEEYHAIVEHGIKPVVIGKWTLRVETAVVACLTLVNLFSEGKV